MPGTPIEQYEYDGAGRRTVKITYDDLDRVVEETNELDDTRYFEYDAMGRLIEKTDRNGRVTEYEYDFLGRQTAEIWKDGQTTVREFSFTYDLQGQLLSASDPDADYDYEYDAAGRLDEETVEITGLTPTVVLTSQYDDVSRRAQIAAVIGGSDDFVTDYLYDSLGRVALIQQYGVQGGNAVAEKRVDFTYDAAGQWNEITRYADLAATDLVATGDYGYDLAGRLTDLTYTKAQTTLVDYDWAFDAGNNMTQYVNSIDGAVDYTNDDAGQLTGADYDYQDDESYTYDDNGNREQTIIGQTTSTYSTGDSNQLAFDGTYTYEYDEEGNRTSRFSDTGYVNGELDEGDSLITIYTWDHRNRLVAVADYYDYDAWFDEEPYQVVEYAYDYQNRLVRKVLDSDGDGTTDSSTVFIHDGDQIALQFDKSGAADATAVDLSHRYLWGPAVDQILADETVDDGGVEDVLWPLTDHLNTTRDLATYDVALDETTLSNHRTFDAYGNLLTETTPSIDHLFAFTSRLFDTDTGLQNNLNRWYDANVGRWLSEDPVEYNGGYNLYSYAKNAPLRLLDPGGTCPFQPPGHLNPDGSITPYPDGSLYPPVYPPLISITPPSLISPTPPPMIYNPRPLPPLSSLINPKPVLPGMRPLPPEQNPYTEIREWYIYCMVTIVPATVEAYRVASVTTCTAIALAGSANDGSGGSTFPMRFDACMRTAEKGVDIIREAAVKKCKADYKQMLRDKMLELGNIRGKPGYWELYERTIEYPSLKQSQRHSM